MSTTKSLSDILKNTFEKYQIDIDDTIITYAVSILNDANIEKKITYNEIYTSVYDTIKYLVDNEMIDDLKYNILNDICTEISCILAPKKTNDVLLINGSNDVSPKSSL